MYTLPGWVFTVFSQAAATFQRLVASTISNRPKESIKISRLIQDKRAGMRIINPSIIIRCTEIRKQVLRRTSWVSCRMISQVMSDSFNQGLEIYLLCDWHFTVPGISNLACTSARRKLCSSFLSASWVCAVVWVPVMGSWELRLVKYLQFQKSNPSQSWWGIGYYLVPRLVLNW